MFEQANSECTKDEMPLLRRCFVAFAVIWPIFLSGCEQLGIDTPATIQARAEEEGKAIGTACRHSVRAMEDCYAMNAKTPKAAIAAGWREMDEYMRENKLEGVAPQLDKALALNSKESKMADGVDENASATH